MISDLLAFGGVGAHPVQPKELAAARPLYECRAALLAAHLAHVEATSPADAGPVSYTHLTLPTSDLV